MCRSAVQISAVLELERKQRDCIQFFHRKSSQLMVSSSCKSARLFSISMQSTAQSIVCCWHNYMKGFNGYNEILPFHTHLTHQKCSPLTGCMCLNIKNMFMKRLRSRIWLLKSNSNHINLKTTKSNQTHIDLQYLGCCMCKQQLCVRNRHKFKTACY